MHHISRIPKKKTAKIQIGSLALLFLTQLTACAPSSGGGSADGEGLMCNRNVYQVPVTESQNYNQDEVSESASTEPKITIDPKFDSYIVEFEEDSYETAALQPSGNSLHEYQVSGLSLKNIRTNTFSLKLTGNEYFKKEMVQRLGNQRKIKFIEPDYPLHLIPQEASEEMEVAATVSTAAQWHHQTVQTSSAWQVTKGSQDIVVAVVDSGIDYNHTDLRNNMWKNPREVANNGRDDDGNGLVDDVYGWNYVSNNGKPLTTSGSHHGTHVAGIIGATGTASRGVYGEAQKVKLIALKFIGDTGTGITSNAIKAIDYAISKRVFAINNSWGSTNRSQALEAAIKRAEKAGILFVVAAGNGDNGVGYDITRRGYYPAAFTQSNILRVAASKSDNTLTRFSNFGKSLVDVAAPGYNILSTITGNSYMKMSGTSMAAPLVTGLAVLVKAANPNLSFSQIKGIIKNSVDPITSLKTKVSSGGRVNARKAVSMAANISSDLSGCF